VVSTISLHLLGGFKVLNDGIAVPLTSSAQRLVSYVALRESADRRRAAADLWPDVPGDQAGARVRTALWRVRRLGLPLLRLEPQKIRLDPRVVFDVEQLLDAASAPAPFIPAQDQLWDELLPGWYDDWVALERERFRSRRQVALEALAERLLDEERYAASLEVALACVAAEPLREAPQEIVARVHLMEGNFSEAVRHLESYSRFLYQEVEDEPSAQMLGMLRYARERRPLLTP
jgi:DNA-binding SARP family transcriptional activator